MLCLITLNIIRLKVSIPNGKILNVILPNVVEPTAKTNRVPFSNILGLHGNSASKKESFV